MDYNEFIDTKTHSVYKLGFSPKWIPDFLFPFQKFIVEQAIKRGRVAIFADCGLGKTPIQLVWAKNVLMHTNKSVLVVTPLAVSFQTINEGEKFGIACTNKILSVGKSKPEIIITNYEKLHYFNPDNFSGIVCDESSILKSFNGIIKNNITAFMRKIPYRLLATATASPNDYIELGTSSEALGFLGYIDMLNKYFVSDYNNSGTGRFYGEVVKWRFKPHAETFFWKWVSSWSIVLRKPSDIGFKDDDKKFILPKLNEIYHVIDNIPDTYKLFNIPARGLKEQRIEKRRSISDRCDFVKSLINSIGGDSSKIMWCQLNDEGDYLEKILCSPQISGKDNEKTKERKFIDFIKGIQKILIIKPKIGAWGLNLQNCNNIIYFPSHSYEQYYQAIRRCWRFGQKYPVDVHIVLTEGERLIMNNIKQKAIKMSSMFDNIIMSYNNNNIYKETIKPDLIKERIPQWL